MTLAMAVSEMGVMPNWNGLKREGRRKLEAEVQAFLWRSLLKGDVRWLFLKIRKITVFYAESKEAAQRGKLMSQERAEGIGSDVLGNPWGRDGVPTCPGV